MDTKDALRRFARSESGQLVFVGALLALALFSMRLEYEIPRPGIMALAAAGSALMFGWLAWRFHRRIDGPVALAFKTLEAALMSIWMFSFLWPDQGDSRLALLMALLLVGLMREWVDRRRGGEPRKPLPDGRQTD
ncbi:MAG TPA: hypothetical protein VD929_02595 [Caulobacteraceae bacterium]|nr:hypothetical protein [Caulobacteraceae bacterium]